MFDGLASRWGADIPKTEKRVRAGSKPRYPADLSADKREEYDLLVAATRNFLSSVKLAPIRGFVKMFVLKRLMEKLKEEELKADAVPDIAFGVWGNLQNACGEQILEDRPQIDGIVEDILEAYHGILPEACQKYIEGFLGCHREIAPEVVRIVAREMWPEVKKKLKL